MLSLAASLGLWFELQGQLILVLAKTFNDICLIVVGRALYRLVSNVLCLKFFDVFVSHLSPYRFRMAIRKGCEVMVRGLQAILDAHLDWVVLWVDIASVFNTILCKAIFQEFQVAGGQLSQLFPFIHSFYGFQVVLFFSHHFSHGGFFLLLWAHAKAIHL